MILKNRNAIIYGGGGSLGTVIAKAFAAAGARVFVTGHHLSTVQKTAQTIIDAGGFAEASQIDALNEEEITSHIDEVIKKSGSVDISFNLIDLEPVQNIGLVEMSLRDFVRPITRAMQSHFLTTTAAGRSMMKQGSGVILSLTATPGGVSYPYTGGFAPACTAIETLSKNLAAELGVYGVRAVNIRSAGSPDSKVFRDAIESDPETMEVVLGKMENDTMLKTLPTMNDIANTALFLCSDMASKITGVTIDLTVGTTSGLNYKVARPSEESMNRRTSSKIGLYLDGDNVID